MMREDSVGRYNCRTKWHSSLEQVPVASFAGYIIQDLATDVGLARQKLVPLPLDMVAHHLVFLGVMVLQLSLVLLIMGLFRYPFSSPHTHVYGFGGAVRYAVIGVVYFVVLQLTRGSNMSVLHEIVRMRPSNTTTGLLVMVLPIVGSVTACAFITLVQISSEVRIINDVMLPLAITQCVLFFLGIGLVRSFSWERMKAERFSGLLRRK